jgi:hypothetical protein
MKLEVKHLAPYLPFKLKAEMVDYKSDYVGKKYDEIIGFHQWDKTGSLWCALTVGGSKPNFQQLKPLLRPLSDITKRINFNGDYLVFLEVIESDYLQDKDSQYLNYLSNYWIGKINSKNISLFQAEMLFKWHFDVFGLIEKGLAVDINTLSVE